MQTKLIMTASAFIFLAHGLVLLFAPELLLTFFSLGESQETASAQLIGAALIGFGLMNWTARGLVLGGIYGRALVHGNFAHSLIGFFVAIRARLDGFGNDYFWIEVVLYLALAIAFGVMLFKGPFSQAPES